MNRIITILVTIFILLLLYIWISHVWGSDQPRHPRQIVDAKETGLADETMADEDTSTYQSLSDTSTKTSETTDEYATERKVDGAAEVKTEPVKTEPAVEKKAPETKTVVPKNDPAPKKVTTPPTTSNKPTTPAKAAPTPAKTAPKPEPKPVTSSAATGGQHLVIAGNFSQLVNAQQRVAELKKAGFPDAEVVNFDLSEYHTVCVGRFSDVNEARKLVKKLKDYHKIDAYVRIGG